MKIIFTKNQAVSALNCISKKVEIDLFLILDPQDPKLKLSCGELERKLLEFIDVGQVAGVVENMQDMVPDNPGTSAPQSSKTHTTPPGRKTPTTNSKKRSRK